METNVIHAICCSPRSASQRSSVWGPVGPTSYFTGFGVLARTFETCQSNDPKLLQRVDELLGVQLSAQGRADDLAGLYVAAWNAFTESFPSDRIQSCPAWTLMNVIDAPTHESVARYMSRGWVGKEKADGNRISAPDCRTGYVRCGQGEKLRRWIWTRIHRRGRSKSLADQS